MFPAGTIFLEGLLICIIDAFKVNKYWMEDNIANIIAFVSKCICKRERQGERESEREREREREREKRELNEMREFDHSLNVPIFNICT